MRNHWLKNHLRRNDDITIMDSDVLTSRGLSWEGIEHHEMPILRNNYMELQGLWNIYVTELELERTKDYGRMYS